MIVRTFTKTRRDRLLDHRRVVEAARRDVNVFARYVFRTKNQPFHKYLHAVTNGPHRKVTVDAPVEHGKTSQFEIIRPVFDLGTNPYELIALVSSTPDLPRRCLGVIRQHAEENERLLEVFPNFKLVESTQSSITVDRRRSTIKDPSIVACGIEGQILGKRWTKLITDDILRFASTHTDHMRQLVWLRLNQECFGRLVAYGRHVDIGTPWVTNDARHKMRKIKGYLFLRFDGWTGECLDGEGTVVRKFEGGLWPEESRDPVTGIVFGWPRRRLEEKRGEMPGYEFDRQIRCITLSQAMEIFGEHLDFALRLGSGIGLKEETGTGGKMRIAWRRPEPGWRYVYTGVDLALDDVEGSAETAFYTGAVQDRRRHVLELRKGKIQGPDIIRNMIEVVRRYPLHLGFRVETNQGQRYIAQFAEDPGLLEAFGATADEAARIRITSQMTTRHNKMDQRIGIGAMAADFEQRRWPVPSDAELVPCDLVREWMDGLKTYDRVSHPDDMVIASWLFWEQCRSAPLAVGDEQWTKIGIWVPP